MQLHLFSESAAGPSLVSLLIFLHFFFFTIALQTENSNALVLREASSETPSLLHNALTSRTTKKKTSKKGPKTSISAKHRTKSKSTKAKVTKPKKKSTKGKKKPTQDGNGSSKKEKMPSEATVQKDYSIPAGKTTALFWSGMSMTKMNAYKSKHPHIFTDDDAFPTGYVDKFRDADGTVDATFGKRIGQVFAKNAPGPEIQLMVPWKEGPAKDCTFSKIEWPIIKRRLAKGEITSVLQVNPSDTSQTCKYDPKAYGLKRAVETAKKVDPDDAPWNVNLDELAVACDSKYAAEQ